MPTGYVYIGVMYVYLLIPLLVLSHAILLYACMQADKQLSAYIVSRLFSLRYRYRLHPLRHR